MSGTKPYKFICFGDIHGPETLWLYRAWVYRGYLDRPETSWHGYADHAFTRNARAELGVPGVSWGPPAASTPWVPYWPYWRPIGALLVPIDASGAGCLRAIWPDFWGCVCEVWPARPQKRTPNNKARLPSGTHTPQPFRHPLYCKMLGSHEPDRNSNPTTKPRTAPSNLMVSVVFAPVLGPRLLCRSERRLSSVRMKTKMGRRTVGGRLGPKTQTSSGPMWVGVAIEP